MRRGGGSAFGQRDPVTAREAPGRPRASASLRPASANQPLGQRRPHRACLRHGGTPSEKTGGGSLASPDRRRKPSDAPPSSWATFGKRRIAAAVASHGMCCAASRQPRASSASSCRRCAHGIAAEVKRERVTTRRGLGRRQNLAARPATHEAGAAVVAIAAVSARMVVAAAAAFLRVHLVAARAPRNHGKGEGQGTSKARKWRCVGGVIARRAVARSKSSNTVLFCWYWGPT